MVGEKQFAEVGQGKQTRRSQVCGLREDIAVEKLIEQLVAKALLYIPWPT